MVVVIPQVLYGAGRHAAYLDPAANAVGLKLNFVTQPVYLWAITLVKVSVGFSLLRIAAASPYDRLVWGALAVNVLAAVVGTVTLAGQCDNLAALWDTAVQAACWPQTTLQSLSYANASQ